MTPPKVIRVGGLPLGPRSIASAAVVAGVAIRFWFLNTPGGGLDGDEAVTGVMAQRIASGKDFYVFFARQSYNSAIEQYPQALLFRLGVPQTPLGLRTTQLMLAGLAIWLMFQAGRRLLSSDWHAALASVLFAFGPYQLIWRGTRSSGSYVSQSVVCLLAIICAIDAAKSTGRDLYLRCLAFGLFFGATYSMSPSAYVILVPTGLWLGPTLLRDLRSMLCTAVGGLLSFLPIFYWWASTKHFPTPSPWVLKSTAIERWGNLTDEIGRQFIGVAYIQGDPGWPIWLGRLTIGALMTTGLIALIRHRRSLFALIFMRQSRRDPFAIVLLAMPLAVISFVGSKYAFFIAEPRYLFASYPTLIFALTALVPRQITKPNFRPLLIAALVAFIALPSLTLIHSRGDDVPPNRDRDLRRAIDILLAEDRHYVYAGYWTATPMIFFAKEKLTVGMFTTIRFGADRAKVDASQGTPPWVGSSGINSDDRPRIRQLLAKKAITYRERNLGDASIFDQFSPDIRPWQVGIALPPAGPPPPAPR